MFDPKWNVTVKVTVKDICKMQTENGTFKPEEEICEGNEAVLLYSVRG